VTVQPVPGLVVETQFAARRPRVPSAAAVRRWAEAAHRAALGRGARARRRGRGTAESLCVRIVGPATSRRLNREYRGKDAPTNVLSFPASREERLHAASLGDLVVCARVVAAEARAQRKPWLAHWAHMVVHGVLHLHGYDHEARRDALEMERLEVEILRLFGYQNPYQPRDPANHG
jgi:probable rRNA maturation factor